MSIKHDIRADVLKNRLYISIKGFMSGEDAVIISDKAAAEQRKLKPGFDVINDIRDLKPATPKASQLYSRQLDVAKEIGVGRVVRVVGDQVITKMQLAKALKNAVGVVAETAASVEEAEKILDKK
jgi:hypothetical protein